VLLDGATGTELERHGIRCELPLWSARALEEAPDAVERIHADYVDAGAEVLTANTFRTQRRTLARDGWGERAGELTTRAVGLARGAAESRGRAVFVVGSAPPLEDCFRPDLVPAAGALESEHAEHARNLADAGVDAILVETMNTTREALTALRAARVVGCEAIVSFVCWDGARLLSGEPLADAIARVAPERPLAVGVNCLPPSNVEACLDVLAGCGLPFGVYPNLGAPVEAPESQRSEELTPETFATRAIGWIDAGAKVVGGCCGTTPAFVAAIAQAVRS
jgi:S-methylmethionine-dependent homocysteine/selenocysteine methylase